MSIIVHILTNEIIIISNNNFFDVFVIVYRNMFSNEDICFNYKEDRHQKVRLFFILLAN